MARLALTVQEPCGSYPALPLTAEAEDFTWTTAGADFVEGAGFTMTERELILVRNDNVAAQTVTVSSMVDAYNRDGDITTYSVGIGEYAMFGPFKKDGWVQADGKLYIAASATDVFFAIIRLPHID